jgi:hypothetical protein
MSRGNQHTMGENSRQSVQREEDMYEGLTEAYGGRNFALITSCLRGFHYRH